jgi:hypothetical protein
MQLLWPPLTGSVAVCLLKWGRPKVTLPDMSAVELHHNAIWRNDSALVPALSPDVAWPVDPRSRWLTRFVDEIQIPPNLGDERRLTFKTRRASLDASIGPGEIDALRRGINSKKRGKDDESAQCSFHCILRS